jgi:hypothetical protein
MTQQHPVPIEQAAAAMQTTSAALRKRIKRGTLRAEKSSDGRWLIYLPAEGQDTGYPEATRQTGRGLDASYPDGQDAGWTLPGSLPDESAVAVAVLQERVSRLESDNARLAEDRERWHGQAEQWRQALTETQQLLKHEQEAASETRRLALLYAPQKKQQELAALLGVSSNETTTPRAQPWRIALYIALALLCVAGGVTVWWYLVVTP